MRTLLVDDETIPVARVIRAQPPTVEQIVTDAIETLRRLMVESWDVVSEREAWMAVGATRVLLTLLDSIGNISAET